MKKIFNKKHLFLNYNNDLKKIAQVYSGQFAIYFIEGGLLWNSEYQAFKFFLKKRFKFFSKLFIRVRPLYKNTKKPIGIRMGKGKGSLDDSYIPISKGQIFVEFGFSKRIFVLNIRDRMKLLKRINNIVHLASLKLNKKTKLIYNKEKWYQ